MTKVLNGPVGPGDIVAYSVRKLWEMNTRIGVVVRVDDSRGLLVRVVKSSDCRDLTRMVWVTELLRVVKLNGRRAGGNDGRLPVARVPVASQG